MIDDELVACRYCYLKKNLMIASHSVTIPLEGDQAKAKYWKCVSMIVPMPSA